MTEQQHNNKFEFKSGATVTLQRINARMVAHVRSATRRRFVEEHGEPKPPTYAVEVAGGEATETHEHNETTIIDPQFAADDEVQAAWREYKRLSRDLWFELHERTTRAHIWLGVVESPPDDWLECWADEREYWGLDVPNDPRDLKFEWVFDLSTGWDELLLLTLAIQRLPDPVEEAAQAALELFRPSVEDAGRADTDADSSEAGEDTPA